MGNFGRTWFDFQRAIAISFCHQQDVGWVIEDAPQCVEVESRDVSRPRYSTVEWDDGFGCDLVAADVARADDRLDEVVFCAARALVRKKKSLAPLVTPLTMRQKLPMSPRKGK